FLLAGVPARLPGLVVAQAESVWMCFLSHSNRLSLLALLCSLLFAGQSFANAPSGAANALVGFRFGYVSCVAFGRSNVVFCNLHPKVRGPLLVAKTAAHWRRAHPLPARAFVHKALGNEQLIHVERRSGVFRLAFRVGDRTAQNLFNRAGRTLG